MARTSTVPASPLAGDASAPWAQEGLRRPSPAALWSPTADTDRRPNHWTPPPTPAIFYGQREELSTRTLHGIFPWKNCLILQIIILERDAYPSPNGRGLERPRAKRLETRKGEGRPSPQTHDPHPFSQGASLTLCGLQALSERERECTASPATYARRPCPGR